MEQKEPTIKEDNSKGKEDKEEGNQEVAKDATIVARKDILHAIVQHRNQVRQESAIVVDRKDIWQRHAESL